MRQSCTECLQWCNENKTNLKKIKVDLACHTMAVPGQDSIPNELMSNLSCTLVHEEHLRVQFAGARIH